MPLSLHDRLAIHEVLNLHGHLFDEGDLHVDRLAELFTEDVVYDLSEFGQPPLHGIGAIRQAALDLGKGNPLAHHVTNIVITSVDGGAARTRCKALAIMADGTSRSATYEDTLRGVDGAWRISSRRVLPRREPLGGKYTDERNGPSEGDSP
jgi:SnoaL-like domain